MVVLLSLLSKVLLFGGDTQKHSYSNIFEAYSILMGYDVANRKMMFLALLTEAVRNYCLILQILNMAVAYPLCPLLGLGMFQGVSWVICMLMDHLGSLQKLCLPRQESVLSN